MEQQRSSWPSDSIRRAAQILADAGEAARMALYASGGYRHGRDAELAAAVVRLEGGLLSPASETPGYRQLRELAAALVRFAWEHPEEHDCMWGQVAGAWKADTDVRTLDGLVFLGNVIALVSDDHDFVVDEKGGTPVVRWQGPGDGPTLDPDSLYETVTAYGMRIGNTGGVESKPAR